MLELATFERLYVLRFNGMDWRSPGMQDTADESHGVFLLRDLGEMREEEERAFGKKWWAKSLSSRIHTNGRN